jgi:Calcineurin-like phosphoesterase
MQSARFSGGDALRRTVRGVLLTVVAFAAWRAAARTGFPAPTLAEGSWRFIVSGDSRNCGDIVMPTIASNSKQFDPKFYWHLGDLRAINGIDEDMAAAAKVRGESLSCQSYQLRAWSDFIENQIAPFGDIPFYVGIGNHEVLPPKSEDAFKRQFHDYLDIPLLRRERAVDGEPADVQPYYHWVQGGVDFIYLDNANNFFSEEQLAWFFRRLSEAANTPQIKSLVIGMHEALPDSVSNDHSMGENADPRARLTGTTVYRALRDFNKNKSKGAPDKPIYVLASHSHLYLANIFETAKLTEGGERPLPGWIAGTAGAERHPLPSGVSPSPNAAQDTYGYLLATVAGDGTITFAFQRLSQSDVPSTVKQRYPDNFIPWCFEKNSKNKPPDSHYVEERCPVGTPDADRASE